MILEIRHVENARTETIRACFEGLFEKHGLPKAIRSDNGSPFASSNGLMGLSRLSAWWLALGIDLERSRPGCPQDNGAHERMHLDIWRELEAGRMGRDQAAFDLWRNEYNSERPHEGLGMATPSEIYRPSERIYEGTPEQLEYGGMAIRRVTKPGTITYQGERILLSSALGGWDVGLAPKPTGEVEVWFSNLLLGHIDPLTSGFSPIRRAPKEAQPSDPLAASATLQQPKDQTENKSVANLTKTCNP